MLLRLILLILVVFIAYQLVRKLLGPKNSSGQQAPNQYEAMISCSHCGLHLPKRESVLQNGRHYCSKEYAIVDESGRGQ